MEKDVFLSKVNELSKLTNEVLENFEHLAVNENTGVLRVKKSLAQNLFNFVLIGEFQSGKSTVANIFCDGHEISPRGMGTKTSSCKITFRSTNTTFPKEKAIVTWKTDKDIVNSLPDFLKIEHQDIDFSSELERTWVTQKIDMELSSYMENPGQYSGDRLDFLHYALLIDRFYNNRYIREEVKKSEYPLEELQSLVKFPNQYNKKWEGMNPEKHFSPEEVRYVFVKHIDCYVNSENINKIQAAIIDCPGLFVSHWDTEIAWSAMKEADAIWFLLNDDKELSQSTQSILQAIREFGWESKTIFSFNTRRPETYTEVKDEIIAKIHQKGWNTRNPVFSFNALLALRAEQGIQLTQNKPGKNISETLMKDFERVRNYKPKNVEEAWLQSVNLSLSALYFPSFTTLTLENAFFIKEISKINVILDFLHDYGVKNKSRMILIENGANELKEFVRKNRTQLELIINSLKTAQAEVEKNWKKAEEELGRFQDFAKEKIDILLAKEDSFDFALQEDYWNRVYGKLFETNIIQNLAVQILEKTSITNVLFDQISKFVNFIAGSDQLPTINKEIEGLIHSGIKQEIHKLHTSWFLSIESNNNEEYQKTIQQRVNYINNELRNKWSEFNLEENSFVEKLNLEFMSGNFIKDIENPNINTKEIAEQRAYKSMLDAGLRFGGTGVFAAFDAITPGLGIALASVYIFMYLMLKDSNAEKKELEDKLSESLKTWTNNSKQDLIEKINTKIISNIRKVYIDVYHNLLSEQKKSLQNNIETVKEKIAKPIQAKKDQISRAEAIIRDAIEPLESKINNYINEVNSLLTKT